MSYLITGHFEELVENSTPEMRSKYAYIIGEVEKQTK
jgi:hypothetical protein